MTYSLAQSRNVNTFNTAKVWNSWKSLSNRLDWLKSQSTL